MSEEIVHVGLPDGQVVDLMNTDQVAIAYDDLQVLKSMIREAEGVLRQALIDHSKKVGKRTFDLEGSKVEVKGGKQTVIDPEGLREALTEAGMPEENINEIIRETVEYKVLAVKARQASAANPDYAAAVEANSSEVEKSPTVSVSRVGGGKRGDARPASHAELTAPPAGDDS